MALHLTVVGNVLGLRVCLFILLCPREFTWNSAAMALFVDRLWIVSTVMENRDFLFFVQNIHKSLTE